MLGRETGQDAAPWRQAAAGAAAPARHQRPWHAAIGLSTLHRYCLQAAATTGEASELGAGDMGSEQRLAYATACNLHAHSARPPGAGLRLLLQRSHERALCAQARWAAPTWRTVVRRFSILGSMLHAPPVRSVAQKCPCAHAGRVVPDRRPLHNNCAAFRPVEVLEGAVGCEARPPRQTLTSMAQQLQAAAGSRVAVPCCSTGRIARPSSSIRSSSRPGSSRAARRPAPQGRLEVACSLNNSTGSTGERGWPAARSQPT